MLGRWGQGDERKHESKGACRGGERREAGERGGGKGIGGGERKVKRCGVSEGEEGVPLRGREGRKQEGGGW